MKIFYVIGDLIGGGSERAVCLLSSEMARVGHDVSIVSFSNKNESYPLNSAVNIIKLPLYHNFFKDFFIRISRLKKVLKQCKPDVVISFTTQKNICTLIAGLFLKTKIIVSERNDPHYDPENKILRFLRKITYRTSDGYVFQTKDAQNYFSKYIARKGIVIPNAIDLTNVHPYDGIKQNKVVIVGRLESQKNTIMAIKAFKKATINFEEVTLEIYGDGPLLKDLKNYVDKEKIQNVFFHGFVTNVMDDIRKAKVFLLPSNYEGISNALLEALALGIPVISTDHPIGGARLLIDDGINGFLVDVGNVDQMSQKLSELLQNNDLQNKFSINSIRRVKERYSVEAIALQWMEYINRICYGNR